MQNKIIVANFKMNKTTQELAEYFSNFPRPKPNYKNTIVLCPPMTGLYFAGTFISAPQIHLGAQNLHFADSGAFTGETSPGMLVDCGAEYVIIGHSERRVYFDEDDDLINRKIKAAINNGLNVILCIGETEQEHGEGQTKNILSQQIDGAIRGIDDLAKIIIAYEPVWAVGNGSPATLEEIAAVTADIKTIIPHIPILYGGSVTEENANDIIALPNVDGVLVGGACLTPKRFAKICGLLS